MWLPNTHTQKHRYLPYRLNEISESGGLEGYTKRSLHSPRETPVCVLNSAGKETEKDVNCLTASTFFMIGKRSLVGFFFF